MQLLIYYVKGFLDLIKQHPIINYTLKLFTYYKNILINTLPYSENKDNVPFINFVPIFLYPALLSSVKCSLK